MIDVEKLKKICLEALNSREFLVELKVSKDNDIIVSVDGYDGMSIDRCVEISRYIESKLDRENEDFSLEVGSPGLSNSFKVIEQYRKNIGKEVDIVTNSGIKHRGILSFVDENYILLSLQKNKKKIETSLTDENIKLEFREIKSTKIVLSIKK